jgi:hypothetical protein
MKDSFASLKFGFKAVACVFVLFLALFLLTGWGATGHKIINRSGAVELPVEMLGFIQRASMLADSASNADSRKSRDQSESPKHFIDIDDYPEFTSRSVPHSLDSLIQKYGSARVTADGLIPWATVSAVDSLSAQMQREDWNRVWSTAADLGHYVGDAHQPLHCAVNYDGQLTGNRGIHSRYESTMIDRFQQSISIHPGQVRYVDRPIDFVFGVIYQSNSYCDSVIEADNYARQISGWSGSGQEPASYYSALWSKTGGFTLMQMQHAADAFADLLYTAWVRAGRPAIPTMAGVGSVAAGHRLFKLEGAYPNPCNPSTTISYVLPTEVMVSLKIFDVTGRLVAMLVDERQIAGTHHIRWYSNVPSGTYFYVLSGGEYSETKKLVVLK